MTSIRETNLTLLDGSTTTLGEVAGDRAILIVNVASKCGLTPQYAGLEEIAEFCSTTYGVTFPLTDKLEVNGDGQHPLFAQLNTVEDAEGHTGEVRWNFEKWLIAGDGRVVARWGSAFDGAAIEREVVQVLGER